MEDMYVWIRNIENIKKEQEKENKIQISRERKYFV